MNKIALLAPALVAGSMLAGCVAYPADQGYGGGYGGGYAAQPAYVAQPGVAVDLSIGWHGDRYYDGRRYWARDDWNRAHPPGPGPGGPGGYHRDDHRPGGPGGPGPGGRGDDRRGGDDHRDDHRW
ncbi:hypothetical protein [Burkholderia sp. Ac-20379]|uniref:hypothetical protein n=1 Tax=Burkholderia sp. Ac-20379 TaxID=2703900 RepID=UPI00197D2FDF|nr:hypothetical protein [Burkholderia sp. Ac-20379]MBN3728747.1 hypothetical protein [Burkholderia sp. Ac-20379]